MDSVEKKFLNYCIDNGITNSYSIFYSIERHFNQDRDYLDSDTYCRLYSEIMGYRDFISSLSYNFGVEAFRILENYRNSNYGRYKRLLTRVEKIVNCDEDHKACFLTFTFDDNCINVDHKKSRKHLVTVLKKFANLYVANEDYGSHSDRFHYHALVQVPIDYHVNNALVKFWDYGFIQVEDIKFKNIACISTYLNKLVAHAKKVTNKRHVLIYSRT